MVTFSWIQFLIRNFWFSFNCYIPSFYRTILTICGGVISLLTVLGNLLVLMSIFLKKSLRSVRSNTFIASLGMYQFNFWIWKERTYKMYLSKTINLCLNELDCSFDGFGGWSSYHAIQYWIPLLQWSLVVICFEVSHLAFFRCYRFLRFYLDFGSNCFGPIYGKSKTGWPKSKVAI